MSGSLKKGFVVLTLGMTLGCASLAVKAAARDGNGFMISASELVYIGKLARRASQPERQLVGKIVADARLRWPYGWVGTRFGTVRSEDNAK